MSSAHLHRHNLCLLILWRCGRKSVFVTLLSAAGFWMTAAAWRSVPRASSGQVAGVTCVTTPVPPVWMQELPTVPAVTPVRPERACILYILFVCLCVCVCIPLSLQKCALICRIFKDLLKLGNQLPGEEFVCLFFVHVCQVQHQKCTRQTGDSREQHITYQYLLHGCL